MEEEHIDLDFEGFFKKEFENRFIEKMPCDEIEDGCEDGMEEGTLVDGFDMAYRIMVFILSDQEIAVFVEEESDNTTNFSMGETIFYGRTEEILPKIIKGGIYPEDVVIFSEDRELFSSTTMNIGEVIDFIIREQERILKRTLNKMMI